MQTLARVLVFLSPLLVAACGPGPDVLFEEGMRAMEAGRYADAYCLWKPLAERKHPAALYQIGWMFANGQGMAPDQREAVAWWRRAAEGGHADAQFALARALLTGDGVDADADQAAPWLWQAAKGGVDDAALMLRDLAGRKGGVALETVRRALRGTHWRALGGVRKIKAERANIRAGIGTDKEQVAVVVQGRELVALSDQQGWVQVAIPGSGEVGWVYESLLGPEQEP